MMKPEVKKIWVAALRSGEYEQAKGVLHSTGGGYCCLGVLAEEAVKAGVIPPATSSSDGSCDYSYDGNIVGLGPNVSAWAELYDWNPVIDPDPAYMDKAGDRITVTAWAANDFLEWSFDRIADAIEANL